MNFFMGIDVGSLSTDGVLIDESEKVTRWNILPTGASFIKTISRCRNDLLSDFDLSEKCILKTSSTGYGRKRVDFADYQVTEISAHVFGAHYYFPGVHTVIDVGGQDTKVIKASKEGGVSDFVMNDRCAAGTGRFLEVMARLLEMDLEEMAERAINAKASVEISSTCTVFAESEIISLISENTDPGAISAGVFNSIAGRIFSMVKGLGGKSPFVITGGVAKNKGIVNALKNILPGKILVPGEPQVIGALGAAIFSRRKYYNDLDTS